MECISFGGKNYIVRDSPINSGGHCNIYIAEETKTGEKVVYRELREKSGSHIELFMNGVNILRMLNGLGLWRFPNVYASGKDWCVREYIEGKKLPVDKGSERFALAVAYNAADALVQFGRLRQCNGVTRDPVHRDIKPDNIVITREGDLYIIDVDTALTNGNDVANGFGTPRYRSPEQQNNFEESPKSDIFSLGITLYEVFTGSVPGHSVITKKIEKYDFDKYRRRVLKRSLSSLGSSQISEVVKRCLRENGEYESPEEMLDEVFRRMRRKMSVRESRLVIARRAR